MKLLFQTKQNDQPLAPRTERIFVNEGNIKVEFWHSVKALQMRHEICKLRASAGSCF